MTSNSKNNSENNSEKLKHPYALALQHYEFISKEFTEYFKMYMQSWSIVGSVIFVGIIFGLKVVESSGNEMTLQRNLLCLTPILFLLWFLPTCWFWGYFDMYRRYLCWLEDKMSNLSGAPGKIICFHSYRHIWFEHKVQERASYIGILLVILIYLGLVWAVLRHIGETNEIWILLLIIYIVAFILSIFAAIKLITIIKRLHVPCQWNQKTVNK
jgi:hypothetical protein